MCGAWGRSTPGRPRLVEDLILTAAGAEVAVDTHGLGLRVARAAPVQRDPSGQDEEAGNGYYRCRGPSAPW